MAVRIQSVLPDSAAGRAGIAAGDTLLRIDGHAIGDVLDYRFYMTEPALTLSLRGADGRPYRVRIEKEQYEDLGLGFGTYLMDRQRGCKNKCIFCFIDQLPPGLRESLYFKDDDARLSFLWGNYITLTNLTDAEVERILRMHISPINVSVHTTNPQLRAYMMGNPRAGQALRHLHRLAEGGIRLNTQIVLCPGINDGGELERTLGDLCGLAPALQSIAVVPVGLTKYRRGLCALRSFRPKEARAVLEQVDACGGRMLSQRGSRICFAADELYLLAGREIPPAEHYEAFDQLENGVGLWALLREEFLTALEQAPRRCGPVSLTLATGAAAQPLLEELASRAAARIRGLDVRVIGVQNEFFGPDITVAGLLTGGDLLRALRAQPPGDAVLIPAVTLRHQRDLFLDGVHREELAAQLGRPVRAVENSGGDLLDAMIRQEK